MRGGPCILALVVAVFDVGCTRDDDVVEWVDVRSAEDSATSNPELSPRLQRRFQPLDDRGSAGESAAMIELGRMLFYDPRLSASSKVSCNTCHPLSRYGVEDVAVSAGVGGEHGRRNAPTVYNASRQFRQFWDGRMGTLEDQAKGPFLNPKEMGMTERGIVRTLESIPGYSELFARAFPDQSTPVTFDNVAIAVASFERGLITPSRWDRYLRGDRTALTPTEMVGAKVFSNVGCLVCHTGEMLGGSMFEKVGVHVAWPNQSDHGRAEVSGSRADDMVFKVPTLRNVTQTAPYFHDGSAQTIKDAVRMMGRHQIGVELSSYEVTTIVAWLGSLQGEIPTAYIEPPELPGAAPR